VAPETDFLAWLDRRDSAALARVFDLLGGRLLLLAGHLTPRGADARDLVQATFLAAMAHGGTWDRRRPLWPWFAAILHNEARMHLRRQRRRREIELGDEVAGSPVVAAAEPDPVRLAAADESFETVVRTIDSLPTHYRQALRLRLVHGLQPIEIAQVLEVPVGTVRAQLHRGLAQLRGALPAGVATALAALFLGDGDLLAQARTFVLERAAESTAVGAAPAACPWLLSGILAMNTKHVVGLILGLALTAWLTFTFVIPSSSASSAPIENSSTGANTVLEPVPAKLAVAQEPLRNDRTAADPAATPGWRLTVRVLDPNGEPITDAMVSVWTAPESGSFWNRSDSDYLRSDVANGRTDARGEFHSDLGSVRDRSAIWRATHWVWAEARFRARGADARDRSRTRAHDRAAARGTRSWSRHLRAVRSWRDAGDPGLAPRRSRRQAGCPAWFRPERSAPAGSPPTAEALPRANCLAAGPSRIRRQRHRFPSGHLRGERDRRRSDLRPGRVVRAVVPGAVSRPTHRPCTTRRANGCT
jgi:RNA polymerase sigma-70 factor (ECF subfamily)